MYRLLSFKNVLCFSSIMFGLAVIVSKNGTAQYVFYVFNNMAFVNVMAAIMIGVGLVGIFLVSSPIRIWMIAIPTLIYTVLVIVGMSMTSRPNYSAIILLLTPLFLTIAYISEQKGYHRK